MKQAIGKISKVIYESNDNDYKVLLFKVSSSDIKEIEGTTINVVGNFYEVNYSLELNIKGEYVINNKYGKMQFNASSFDIVLPSKKEKIIAFLTSSLFKGCGKKTAEKLVEYYGEETLEKIKELDNILKVPGITNKTAEKLHVCALSYTKSDEVIKKLEEIGFSPEDSSKILSYFKNKTEIILKDDIYLLKEVIDFNKIDNLFIRNNDIYNKTRIYHLLIETMKYNSFSLGDTYYYQEDLIKSINTLYNLNINNELFEETMESLLDSLEVIVENDKIYLYEYYEAESTIASKLKFISLNSTKKIKDFDEKIERLESNLNIEYDDKQKRAIKEALENNITIISGGPGTGKTTLLKALLNLYIDENKLSSFEITEKVGLLAPTGRASKKMSLSTNLYSSTIHRALKWHKESDSFEYNIHNKLPFEFVVIDESSMIDVKLFSSLLCALKDNVKLILVGDSFQLPSVGPGMVLNNLIESELFNYISLTKIYRQSDNSYIPFLAASIKSREIDEEILNKKDDYNFIMCEQNNIKSLIKQVAENALTKGINEHNMQILVPMYKGINGIDEINNLVRNIYNPRDYIKKELVYNNIIYRENDKILQLTNDPDRNIFNGDIGIIKRIEEGKYTEIVIDFEGNIVTISKKDLKNIKHAYVISIHKSQGSEFDHVIMPISREYFVMMYNKLIYTGVSRAKKSLILIGDPKVFYSGVNSNRSSERKTTLKDKIISIMLEK